MWVRQLTNGATLMVCGLICLDVLMTDTWTDGFVEVEGPPLDPLSCAHCYACGQLVVEPDGWCPEHGINCPSDDWRRTAVALNFARSYFIATGGFVSDALWEVVESEFYSEPWLTGEELARRATAL